MSKQEQSFDQTVGSALKIPHVVFDEISFVRKGFKHDESEPAIIGVASQVTKVSAGRYQVTLQVEVEKEDEYDARVRITGFCEIDEDYEHKDTLLQENAVAILFPYVRAELTLITAQPGTEPIILPVLNITAMIQQADTEVG